MQIGLNLSLTLEHGGAGAPTLDMTFTGTGNALDSRITFTRTGTNATYFNSAGVLTSAGADVPRFDYNPATLAAQGLLIEEQRTNSIRNNTMQGATAGAPGVFPTNWSASLSGSGVTQEIAAVGTENGIAYVDVRYFGTPTSGTNVAIGFEGANQIVAASGQTWAESVFLKLQAGSFNNTSTTLSLLGTDGVSGTESITSSVITSTPSNLRESRISVSGTFANALTTRAQPRIRIGYTVGVAFDITLRIGLPQLEQGAFATSVIPTTTTALTRNRDEASVNTLSPWFNATAGTIYAEATPNTPTTNTANQIFISIDDTTTNNRIQLTRGGGGGAYSTLFSVAGVVGYNPSLGTWANQTSGKLASAFTTADQKFAYVGALDPGAGTGAIPSVTRMLLGARADNTLQFNGWLRRVVFYPRRLSNTELQAITV